MILSNALEGLTLSAGAEGRSPHTIIVYQYGINKLIQFLGDADIESLTRLDLDRFFNHLRNETALSESSIAAVWRAVRVLYKWAEKDLKCKRPDADIPRPKPPDKQILPFTQDECRALIKACEQTRQATGKMPYVMHRMTADRDRAILLTFLDTGMRVSELARLKIGNLDMHTGEIRIEPYKSGLKSRGRSVYLSGPARSAIWRYLSKQDHTETEPLFRSNNQSMNRDSLYKLLRRLGQRAGKRDVHPHRFRHTFAIQYLRNGGDVFTLQILLGHASWKMVRRYLDIAQSDCEQAHKRASPVENWKLW